MWLRLLYIGSGMWLLLWLCQAHFAQKLLESYPAAALMLVAPRNAMHPELRNAADTLRSGTASRLYAVHPPMNIHVHVLTYRAWGVRVGACDRNVPTSESEWRTSEEVGLFSVLRSHDLPFACLDNKHSLAQIAVMAEHAPLELEQGVVPTCLVYDSHSRLHVPELVGRRLPAVSTA